MAEAVVAGISSCVDDLGLLLDQIYKFPERQREQYFVKIQGMKDKLLTLKANVRESNLPATQKQFKQIYLAVNSLKGEAMSKISLTSNKQNRDINRSRESKRNYEEALKLIAQKDDRIEELSMMVFEKEQLIKVNYEQLRQFRKECQLLTEERDVMHVRINQLLVNCEQLSITSRKSEEELLDLHIKNQEGSCELRRAVEEIESLKTELTIAYDKLVQYEEFAEISMKKTRLVEENIRRVESQAQNLNANYRLKESQNLKRLREKDDLQAHLGSSQQTIQSLTHENSRLKKDNADLQKELVKMQTHIYDLRSLMEGEKQKQGEQIGRWQQENEYYRNEVQSLKRQLGETVNKYENTLGRINQLQQQQVEREQQKLELSDRAQDLQSTLQQFTSELRNKDQELIFHSQENAKLAEQLERQRQKCQGLVKQLQRVKDQCRQKDEQRYKAQDEIKNYQQQIRRYQQESVKRLENQRQLQGVQLEQKAKISRLEQQYRRSNVEIDKLKVRLLRSKIETIHQIRASISP